MIKKVVSGGQTGADQAGLRAARIAGLKTGGFAPKGFKTNSGEAPWLGDLYGLQESKTSSYSARTRKNVEAASATILFATVKDSPGTLCTKKWIGKRRYYHKCVFIDPRKPPSPAKVAKEVSHYNTLNIAGNSEETSPGIYNFVLNYLEQVFECLL